MKKLFPIILLALFIACLSKIANGQDTVWMKCTVIGCECVTPIVSFAYADMPAPDIDWLGGDIVLDPLVHSDTIPAYMYDAPLYIPGNKSEVELLNIRFRQVVVQELVMGKKAVYIPETNVEQGNSLGDKTKVITYQVAMSDSITPEMMAGIKQAIDSIMFWKPVPVIIDTVDAEVSTFTGTWRIGDTSAPGWMFNTIAYSNTPGSEAIYKHPQQYKRIEIYGERFTSHGKIGISIDQGQEVIVDLYSPTRQLPSLLHSFDVPMGDHEIKIRILGEKNEASTGTFGLVDFYKITR